MGSLGADPATSSLGKLVGSGRTVTLPGAPNALTARIIEEIGFEAVYVTGAGIANTFRGVPDIGLITLSELVAHVAAIREAVDVPLIVDADTGFGNPLNVWRTVRELERAGADAVQIEDQTFPKRCGHFDGKSVVDAAEMVDKVTAACEARRDDGIMIIARSDARSEHGLGEAIRRVNLYRAAGADVTFVEAPLSESEIELVAREVEGPKVLNIVRGGVTPTMPPARIAELGFAFALHANLALLAAIHATREALTFLRERGTVVGGPPTASWEERQSLVRKADFDALATRYGQAANGPRAHAAR